MIILLLILYSDQACFGSEATNTGGLAGRSLGLALEVAKVPPEQPLGEKLVQGYDRGGPDLAAVSKADLCRVSALD